MYHVEVYRISQTTRAGSALSDTRARDDRTVQSIALRGFSSATQHYAKRNPIRKEEMRYFSVYKGKFPDGRVRTYIPLGVLKSGMCDSPRIGSPQFSYSTAVKSQTDNRIN